MIDILGLMEPIAILVASVVVYIFYFQIKIKKESNFYKNPDWNFVFRKWFAERQLNKIKLNKREKLKENLNKNLSERPLLLKNESSSDMILFYGTDQIGNSVLLRMTRLRHRIADLWIMIRLKNKNNNINAGNKYYMLPEHPITRVYEVKPGTFKAAGLEFECLEPFVRWRITYNGYLREKIRNEINDDIVESELKFIKFNFFFTGSNKPLFWPLDWSSKLMANGLATETWKDGNWPNILNIPGNGGYDQFGRMLGQIFLPNNEVKELNLPGLRQRRWEAFQNINLRRQVSIFGVCSQGCIFNIGAISYKSALTHVQFGNVRLENDKVYPIDWTDLRILNVAEEIKTIPQRIAIHFKAGGRNFKAFLYLEQSKFIKLLNGSPFQWRIINIPTKFDLNGTTGLGVFTSWHPYKPSLYDNKLKQPQRFRKLVFNTLLPDRNKFVLSFSESEAQSKLVSGGKGASLALLTAASRDLENLTPFKVPEGFVVSSSALRQFLLTNSEIYVELRNLEDCCSGKLDGSLEKYCEKVKDLFATSILDRNIGTEIRKAFETVSLEHKNPCFAVRSSGVDEDGKEFSSAGQNETILGVRGLENILEAIKLCWASLYSYRSVEYRRKHSQSTIADMAVVVQIMIPSECSGVLFTKHSIAQNSCDMLVTANFGLGETVVSGVVEPDTFIIDKNYDSTKFKIKERMLGEKAFSLVLNDTGGVKKVENKMENVACCPDEIILNLAKIGINLEKMYGDPQDIEWGVVNNTIYLLQSRPITTLKQFSDWEYLHEFDSPMMSCNQILTRGNVGEVLTGALDNLTASTVIKALNLIWLHKNSDEFEKLLNTKGLLLAYQQVFMDLVTFFIDFKPGKVTSKEKVQGFGMLASLELTSEMKLMSYKQLLMDINIIIKKNLPDVMLHHMNTSTANSCMQGLCLNILLGDSEDFSADHISDLQKIMNASEGVISAEIPKKIDEIANTIYLQSNVREFLNLNISEVPLWLEENSPVAYRLYNQFLRTYGHRCLNEFCLNSIPWENNVEYIIKMIQDNLKQACVNPGHVFQETEPKYIVEDLRTPKSNLSRCFLGFLIPYCRSSVQKREASKDKLIYFINILRKHFNKLSELMQIERILPEKDLIFFLSYYELQQLIYNDEIEYVQKAIRRQKLYKTWNKIKFPDVIMGLPKPIVTNTNNNMKFESGSKIKGLPAQNGIIEGRACVLTDITEIDQIKSGDILITLATDIAWSPVFPILGGLVTELGGLISHGAVVAREYGLPCIIGAKNATNCFKTGDKVFLDANSGFITKL
ncbi:uncharacterized phosphotransferase YvkC-like [Condylostylus longicornis]|uniref:uncharacterized phosphotransferase YvkC-like n=1 Tax=Condylostylus longicornis TaxID=2530218 RepID=UPI00244DCB30|nr:uncharacterized phosphotransferase YvkC-like [Condylostylus longicornis]